MRINTNKLFDFRISFLGLALLIFAVLQSCENKKSVTNEKTSGQSENNIGDTITTKSGLQYIFLKKGNGEKIQKGSKVKVFTDLYVNDSDTTIWTTSESKDSVFTFIHQKTPLIKGFVEVHNHLREGDEIIAILPDSLAYGKGGRDIIPPAATLIYNPLIVKSVSAPKLSLSDTLYHELTTLGTDAAIKKYEWMLSQDMTDSYHMELDLLVDLLSQLSKDNKFEEVETLAGYFYERANNEEEKETFLYFEINSAEKQGKYAVALDYVLQSLEKHPDILWLASKKTELEGKVAESMAQ